MNEWKFTGEAASWINERIHSNPQLPFSGARTEQRGQGSLKRRDLTLLDKNKMPVLTGEAARQELRGSGLEILTLPAFTPLSYACSIPTDMALIFAPIY